MSMIGQIRASTATDQGQVRGHNEDFAGQWEPSNQEEERQNGWLYIVSDGVGGAEAGEVASEYATQQMKRHFLATSDTSDWSERILSAMRSANTDLRTLVAENYDHSRMATTMVAACIHDGQATIGNVGDSRCYFWRAGHIQQITKDQSLVAKLVEEGAITEQEAANHPRKNVILYSIGSEKNPQIDVFKHDLQSGDMLILCSDGLTRHVPDDEIGVIVDEHAPETAVSRLVDLANERGGEDNITVTVIQYGKKAKGPRVVAGTTREDTDLTIYTIALSLVMSLLIFLTHYWLQV